MVVRCTRHMGPSSSVGAALPAPSRLGMRSHLKTYGYEKPKSKIMPPSALSQGGRRADIFLIILWNSSPDLPQILAQSPQSCLASSPQYFVHTQERHRIKYQQRVTYSYILAASLGTQSAGLLLLTAQFMVSFPEIFACLDKVDYNN